MRQRWPTRAVSSSRHPLNAPKLPRCARFRGELRIEADGVADLATLAETSIERIYELPSILHALDVWERLGEGIVQFGLEPHDERLRVLRRRLMVRFALPL